MSIVWPMPSITACGMSAWWRAIQRFLLGRAKADEHDAWLGRLEHRHGRRVLVAADLEAHRRADRGHDLAARGRPAYAVAFSGASSRPPIIAIGSGTSGFGLARRSPRAAAGR